MRFAALNKFKISLLCYTNAVILCHMSNRLDHPEPNSAQLLCVVWGFTGQTQCTVALLTRCLRFPSAAATQRATTKKLHLSVLLHIKPGCYLHFTVLVVSNTTDRDHITTSSSLLTGLFSIKVIMEG